MVKFKNLSLILLVFVIFSLILSPKLAHAKFVDDFIGQVKDFINLGDDKNVNTKEIRVESDISLAPDGDMDKNGVVDAGDIVRFTYTLTNTTDTEYSFGTLKTHIDRKMLNFIHNVRGASGLIDENATIEIPNIVLSPHQMHVISFDARINYHKDEDKVISTDSELFTHDNKPLSKSQRKEVHAKKMSPEKIRSEIKEEKGKSQ